MPLEVEIQGNHKLPSSAYQEEEPGGMCELAKLIGFYFLCTLRTSKTSCLMILLLALINTTNASTDEQNRGLQTSQLSEECDSSCLTCDPSGGCATCTQYMKLNTTSKLCEYCPDRQFYAISSYSCLPCDLSCNMLCSYQEKCFECPTGEFYDIEAKTCVANCNSATQIVLNNTQTGNRAYCRGLNYYVNSDSIGVIETGTKEYPYRSLSLVFVELLNYFSNTNYTINVYIKESTDNYLKLNFNYLLNITRVNFLSYSDGENTPQKANLILTDGEVQLFSSKSQYNILKNADLNTTIANDATSQALNLNSKIIFVYKSEASFTSFKVTSIYSNIELDYNFVYALGQNELTVNFTDIHSEISGSLFLSFDHCTVYMDK